MKGDSLKAIKDVVKRFARGEALPGDVVRLLMNAVSASVSAEECCLELCRCFLAVRASFRNGSFPAGFPLSELITAFKETAQGRGVDPERFYRSLVECMAVEPEPEDAVPTDRHTTKERILDAALEVFSEKGFHSATVDEIAERAGVGKGTLYRHFSNKETLFNDLVRLRIEDLERDVLAVLDDRDDVLTMITKYLKTYFEFFDRNQGFYRLILQERIDVGEQVQDLYFKMVMRRIPLLKRKIYEAGRLGDLKKDVDFQTVFYGVMGFIHGVIQKWLARDCSYSLVEELPGVVEVLFYGFVAKSKDA